MSDRQQRNGRLIGGEVLLGELESRVLDLVWRMKSGTVREVKEKLSGKRSIAYTTVMTTMDRLYEKGYLTRVKRGKGYVYAPRVSRQEVGKSVMKKWLRNMLRAFGEPSMSCLVEAIREVDSRKLDELAALIEEERRKDG
jgi:predicted transcriptional regulator